MGYIKYRTGIIVQSPLENFLGSDVQMIGRLIEDQEIRIGEHQLCQRYTSPFTTTQITDQLENIISGKKKSSKHVPDLCVGKCRIIIGNFFKDRLIHMKDVVFLIVVTNLHIGTQCKGTAVCPDHIVQNLEKRSFSGSVVANDGYMFPTLDLETDICEKCLWRKGFT